MIEEPNAYVASDRGTLTPPNARGEGAGDMPSPGDGSLLFISYEESSAHNGLNTRMNGIARALAARGRRVEIASPLYGGRARMTVTGRDGIRIHMIPVPDLLSRGRIPIVSRILSVICLTVCMVRHLRRIGARFAWIQAEQIYPFPAACLLAREWNAAVILDDPSRLGLFVEEKLKRRRILRPLLRKSVEALETSLFRRADCILCSSGRQAERIRRRIRASGTPVRRLCNGVDSEEFTVAAGVAAGNRVFFNCSVPYYQNTAALRNLLKIFSHFERQAFRDYSALVIVNDAAALPSDLAAAIRSNPRVRLLANQPSIVPWLQSCDLVLLPYEAGHTTTAGPRLKVFEALACGKIVLGTKEGLDEVAGCVDGGNVVFCSDWLDMADKTMALIREGDSARKRRMRDEARRFIEARYSWRSLAATYDSIRETPAVEMRAPSHPTPSRRSDRCM
jgi:glycosyltransferase involved in cell wall biosynthesis